MMDVNRAQYGVVAVAGVVLLALGAGAATIAATSTGQTADGAAGGSGSGGAEGEDFNLTDSDSVLPVVGGNFDVLLNESGEDEEGHNASGRGEEGGGESTLPSPTPSVPSVLLVLAAVGVVGVLAVLARRVRSGSDDVSPSDAPGDVDADGDGESAALAAVGSSAGTGADRLAAESGATNVVYETWLEMARSLDVDDPASSTPGEFASAAVEAGMSRDDVERLTSVFRGVRYGGEDVTAAREREARAAFRRIERTYDDGDSP